MGHPNEDLIRRGYDAFSNGDMDTLRELFHPEIVWHAGGRSQLTGGNFRVEVHDILANDEHAVGLHTAHAEREGKTLQDNNTLVFHVRDRKVTEVWQYWADPYAADELFA
jgi:uncharacterized protein